MRLLKTNCVATISYARYRGDLFILHPTNSDIVDVNHFQNTQTNPHEDVWALFNYYGTRTAEDDWDDFGILDHCRCDKEDARYGDDIKGHLLLAPGTWTWFGQNGRYREGE